MADIAIYCCGEHVDESHDVDHLSVKLRCRTCRRDVTMSDDHFERVVEFLRGKGLEHEQPLAAFDAAAQRSFRDV